MSDESQRVAEFERRLESLGRDAALAPEPDGLADLAGHVRRSLTPPAPRAAFTASARARLLSRLPRRAAEPGPHSLNPALTAFRRLAVAVASVLVAFALSTGGIAHAAQEAIPGDSLYGVKRAIESARWSLTVDPQSQALLLSDLADERLREIEGLTETGRAPLLAPTLDEYEQALDQLQAVADTLPNGVRAQVLSQASDRVQQHQQVLQRLLGEVPAQAVPAIERAIERSSHSHEVLDALQQVESPSDLAPGQSKTKEPGPRRTPGPPETKGKP